jgi:hypothetical protein
VLFNTAGRVSLKQTVVSLSSHRFSCPLCFSSALHMRSIAPKHQHSFFQTLQPIKPQVYELLDVLEQGGADAVAAHNVPLLSWQEVRALTAPGTVGLPLGYTPAAAAVQSKGMPAGLLTAAANAAWIDDYGGADGGVVDCCGVLALANGNAPACHGLPAAAFNGDNNCSDSDVSGRIGCEIIGCAASSEHAVAPRSWRRKGLSRTQYIIGV